MHEVTQVLSAIEQGDPQAAEQLLPLVYDELRKLAAAKLQTAKDLADARKQFLPFSTAVVDLTKQLRKQDKGFAELKVYHCPMAPEPGLWIQAKAPLANPYYGSKMLRCGEEVTR